MSSLPDRPLERTHITSTNLRQAWQTHAAEFIAWARKPHHDSYWRFHRAQFLHSSRRRAAERWILAAANAGSRAI